MPDPILQLSEIRKSYFLGKQELPVLKGITMNIKKNEYVALMGPSGSGKSTLMNILGCLDSPTAGSYILNGKDVSKMDDGELAEVRNKEIGFVFQQFNLLPRFDARHNVALPLIYRNLSTAVIDTRVMQALTRVGMQQYAHHRPAQLSGGQQQRVAIARALVGEPSIILADEPTGALDSRTGAEVLDLFLALHQEGRTIIMITHDEHIASQCGRRIIMADGAIMTEPSL